MNKMNVLEYKDDMENINSKLMDEMFYILNNIYNPNVKCTEDEVKYILDKNEITLEEFQILLSDNAENYLNDIAIASKNKKNKYFGNSILVFTPLYISNFCENGCLYCGYNCLNKIKRAKLTFEQIELECLKIAKTGLKEILILTGESKIHSNIEYVAQSIKIAKKYFQNIGIEIYPLNTDEYKLLKSCGADFVSVYQETYNIKAYDFNHPNGPKRSFIYRFNSQERAINAGFIGVSLGSLLGLYNYKYDALASAIHGYLLYKNFPYVELSFSVPRIRPFSNNQIFSTNNIVSEKKLLQIMCAYRLLFPFAGITISTRERPTFRDNIIHIAATKISAGVKVSVGGHEIESKGDEQFDILDNRSVKDINHQIITSGLQPVYINHISL